MTVRARGGSDSPVIESFGKQKVKKGSRMPGRRRISEDREKKWLGV